MQNLSIRDDWVGLESNPDVLTEYAHKLGVDESWGFVDVFGLDEESLKHVPDPCVGMILLFPFSQREAHRRSHGTSRGRPTEGVWFMRQVRERMSIMWVSSETIGVDGSCLRGLL